MKNKILGKTMIIGLVILFIGAVSGSLVANKILEQCQVL